MYLQYWHPIILNINNNFLKFKMTWTYNWIRTKRQIKLIPYCLMSVGGFFHGNNLQGTKISQLKQNGFVRWLWAVKTYKYVIRQRSRNTVIRSNCWVSENDFIPYQLLYLLYLLLHWRIQKETLFAIPWRLIVKPQ